MPDRVQIVLRIECFYMRIVLVPCCIMSRIVSRIGGSVPYGYRSIPRFQYLFHPLNTLSTLNFEIGLVCSEGIGLVVG